MPKEDRKGEQKSEGKKTNSSSKSNRINYYIKYLWNNKWFNLKADIAKMNKKARLNYILSTRDAL